MVIVILLLSAGAFSPGFGSFYFHDDIVFLTGTLQVKDLGSFCDWLAHKFNEHYMIFTKLFILGSLRLFGLHYWPVQLLMTAGFWGALLLLWLLSKRWFTTRAARATLIGILGVTPIFYETVVWVSAFSFMIALLLSCLALLGIEWHAEGRRRCGLTLAFLVSFLAPWAGLIGLPTGVVALVYCAGRLRLRGRRLTAAALAPGLAGLLGLALFIAADRWISTVAPSPAGPARAFDWMKGMEYAGWALFRVEWGGILPIVGPALILAAAASLIAFRRFYRPVYAVGFLALTAGYLAAVYLRRSWLDPSAIYWGRYHLYPAVGTAGLIALGVEAFWKARIAPAAGRKRRIAGRAIGGIFLLVLAVSAGFTAHTVWREMTGPVGRFVKPFHLQWARFPDEYARATGATTFQLPDIEIQIYQYCPSRPLVFYSYCWPRHHDWRVEWVPAEKGFDPRIVQWISHAKDMSAVRHFLRRSLYSPPR